MRDHVWAAVGQFWETPEGRERLFMERDVLAQEYPGFTVDVHHNGTTYATGIVGPNRSLRGAYRILVALPPNYGDGVMPVAHVVEPDLPGDTPHRFIDGSLCLDHGEAYTKRSTIVTLLAWVSAWLFHYEEWRETGRVWV